MWGVRDYFVIFLIIACRGDSASVNRCGNTDWEAPGNCHVEPLVTVRKIENMGNSSVEEACCSNEPRHFRCRTGMELNDTSEAGRYELVVENPILFAQPPSFRPADLKLATMFLTLKDEAAGASKVVVLYNNSVGIREVVASYEVLVQAGESVPSFRLPFRVACMDLDFSCDCPTLGTPPLELVALTVSCRSPCAFRDAERFKPTQGLYASRGAVVDGRPLFLKRATDSLNAFRLYFNGSDSRWYIREDAPPPTPGVPSDPDLYFRSVAFSALDRPDEPAALWEEYQWDSILGRWEWEPSAGFVVLSEREPETQCRPTAITDPAYTPTLAEELTGGSVASVAVLDASGADAMAKFAVGITSTEFHLKAGESCFTLGNGTSGMVEARLKRVTEDPVADAVGLEYALQLDRSADGKLLFAAEFASDSISVFNLELGDAEARFVERRRQNETRHRFVGGEEAAAAPIPASAVCDLQAFTSAGGTDFVAVAAGCGDLRESTSSIDFSRLVRLDRPSLHPCLDQSTGAACLELAAAGTEALWEATVGWWDFASEHAVGSLQRPRKTDEGCQEANPTAVAPSAIRDVRGLMGDAELLVPECKTGDWDRDPAGSLSVDNFLMADGGEEAMQFDPTLNAGVSPALDIEPLLAGGLLPTAALAAEVWVTINAADLPHAGIIGAQRSGSTYARGWLLGYSVRESAISFDLTLVVGPSHRRRQLFALCDPSLCAVGAWLHLVASYNGTHAALAVNGKPFAALELCAAPERDAAGTCGGIQYPRRADNPDPFGTPLVIGAYVNRQTGRVEAHVGAIHRARLFSRALTQAEIEGQFRERMALIGSAVRAQYFWARTASNSSLGPASPNVTTADAAAPAPLKIRGRFDATVRHRCRFSRRFHRLDTTTVATVATPVDVNGSTAHGLVCSTPTWQHGFAHTSFGVEHEVALAPRDPHRVFTFEYVAGTSVEITTFGAEVRYGTIVEFNAATGEALIDLPAVYIGGEYKDRAFVEALLPDVNIYPLPPGGAPEPIWVPVWQRLCAWAECGYLPPYSRAVGEREAFTDIARAVGLPTTVTFTTKSLLLRVDGAAVADSGARFPGVAAASSITPFSVAGESYLLAAVYEEGDSVLYRLDDAAAPPALLPLQHIPSAGARKWARLAGAASDCFVLASYDADLAVYCWNASAQGSLLHVANISGTAGASDVAAFEIEGASYFAVATFYDRDALSYNASSRLFRVDASANASWALGTAASVAQEWATRGAAAASYGFVDGLHMLIFASAMDDSAPLMVWDGARFTAYQEIPTEGGAASALFYQLGSVPFLVAGKSCPCNTFRSGLSGGCTTALRWNGTRFNALATAETLPKDTAGGQELPGATAFAIAGDTLVSARYQADAAVPRTLFVESGRRQALTKNVPLRTFTAHVQTIECLGAPVAMVVDQAHRKLYVASYHHNAISVFESDDVGELWAQPSSQCIPVQQPSHATASSFPPDWHPRGIAGMVMSDTADGCFGDSYPRCLYVLNSAQSEIHVFAVEPLNASLRWAGMIRQHDAAPAPSTPRIPDLILGLAAVRSFRVSASGAWAFAGGHGDRAVAAFARNPADGTLAFADVVRQGEKLFWEFGKAIPGPSPQLLSEQTVPEPDTAGLSSVPSRVDPDVVSVFETAHFAAGGVDYLVAACGERGAMLYAWSPADRNFSRVQEIAVGGQPDSNAVGVTLVHIAEEVMLVVSSWLPDDGSYTGTRVYRWWGGSASFEYNHTLSSSPPIGDTNSGYRQLFRYGRKARAFSIDGEAFLAVPWYGFNIGSGEIAFSMIYQWSSASATFEYYQHVPITGAVDVAYMLAGGDAADGEHLLVFTSLFSFAGGCATTAEIAVCSGARTPSSSSVVLRWNATSRLFEEHQRLPSTGGLGALPFRLPCACATHPADACSRDYLLVANRQRELPENVVSLDAYDEDPSLFVWDGALFAPLPLGAFDSIPAPPFPDSCEDLDQYDVNLTLPYGPCFSYVEGGFNFGFCVADEVCDICQGSCATECDTPCQLSDIAAYQRRLAGLWPSREQVEGLRGAGEVAHFEVEGEHFLAVAQSVCGLLQTGRACIDDQRTQPQSAILQWRGQEAGSGAGAEGLFGELLALPPDAVDPAHRDLHSWAMRVPAGGVASWRMVQLPTSSGPDGSAGEPLPLLLAASATEGLVAYPWTFRRADALSTVEDIQTDASGRTAYVVSSADDAVAAFEVLDPAAADPALLPVDSLGALSTRIRFGMASSFPDGVLEGARALKLSVDAASGEVDGLNVSRGLPLSNLMCGPIRVDFEHANPWQAFDYGVGCNVVNFSISAESDTPPASALLERITLSPSGTLGITPVPRASGTVLLKASIESARFSQLRGAQGPRPGNQHLLWASVLKTNTAPSLEVNNVSLRATGETVNVRFAQNLSTGAADEAAQRLFFSFRFSNPALFAAQPVLSILDDASANVSFDVVPGQRGTAVFVVTLQDTGGTIPLVDSVVGDDSSDPKTFFVTIAPAYNPPTFAYAVDSLVLLESPGRETRGGFVDLGAVVVSLGDNGLPLPYYFALTEVRPDRGAGTVNVAENFVEAPTLSPEGTLSLWPVDNFYGQFWLQFAIRDATWGVCSGGGGCSSGIDDAASKEDLLLLIISVNDAPSFAVSFAVFETLEVAVAQEVVFADFLSQVSAGGGDESLFQNVSFILSDFTPGCDFVFASPPRVAVDGASGDLVFTQSPGTSGACNFSIVAVDDGDAVNGGSNISAPALAQVVTIGVNNAPSFDTVDRVTVVEGVGARSLSDIAVNISAGPPDEVNQSISFLVFSDSPELFAVQPAVDAQGTLSFWLAPERFGVALLSVQAVDDGGDDNGGRDRSVESRAVVVEILPQPRISAAQPTIWLSSSVPAADTLITIRGAHFAPQLPAAAASSSNSSSSSADDAARVRVLVNGEPCLETLLLSDEAALCRGFRPFAAAAAVNLQVRERDDLSREGSLPAAVRAVALAVAGMFDDGEGFVLTSDAATRAPLFARADLQFDRAVRAVAIAQQSLFCGGTFQRASGVRANYVLGWDGGRPFSLGFGMNGAVNALAAYRGALVVAGSFTSAYRRLSAAISAGDRATVVSAPGLVAWNGEDWEAVQGAGSPAGVMTAAVAWREILYVAGKFRNRMPTPEANGLARYNGTLWTALCGIAQGCGVQGGDVLAISAGTETCVECDEEVVVGGTFASAAGVATTRYIARWDGSIWSSVGELDGPVNAIARINTVIYVGGSFAHADGLPVNGIAKLASDGWSQVGSGLTGTVFTLQPLFGCIYVGGDISAVGHYDSTTREWSPPERTEDVFGQPISNLVRWCVDDFAWEAVRMLDDSDLGAPLAIVT